jgi:hypothetical protein
MCQACSYAMILFQGEYIEHSLVRQSILDFARPNLQKVAGIADWIK